MTDLADAVAFAQRVLGIEVWEHQKAPLRCKATYTTVAGGRRSGKTEADQIKAIHVCATTRGAQVLVVHPSIDSARSWLRETADILRASKIKDSVADEETQVVRFSNGSEIRVIPATAGQLRGRGRRLLLVVLEEGGFQDASVWRDVRYALLDNLDQGAQLWQVGSPWGPIDHPFRSAYMRGVEGDPDYASFRFRTVQNPHLPADFIERERRRLAPSEIAAELDGEWSEAAGSLWPHELIERCTADLHVPALHELPAGPIGLVALDTGVSFDHSAAIFLYRLPVQQLNPDREWRPTFMVIPHVWPQGTAMRQPVEEIVASPASLYYWSIEINGVGSMVAQEIQRRARQERPAEPHNWNLCHTSASIKTAVHTCALGLAERGQLVFPRHPDLLRQLAGLKFQQGARGFLHIEAEQAAVHDDVADALMLACLPYSRPKRGAVCHLLRLADPTSATEDAVVPETDGDVVKTGGGLRVWRRPPLQSLAAGGEVSVGHRPTTTATAAPRLGRYALTTTGGRTAP